MVSDKDLMSIQELQNQGAGAPVAGIPLYTF